MAGMRAASLLPRGMLDAAGQDLQSLLSQQMEFLEEALDINRTLTEGYLASAAGVLEKDPVTAQMMEDVGPSPDDFEDGAASAEEIASREEEDDDEAEAAFGTHSLTTPLLSQRSLRKENSQEVKHVVSFWDPRRLEEMSDPASFGRSSSKRDGDGTWSISGALLRDTKKREQLAEVVRVQLDVPQVFREEDQYKEDGICSKIALSMAFRGFMLTVVILNTLWLGGDTDLNKARIICEAPLIFQVMDNAFLLIFLFEICVRWGAASHPWACLRSSAFCFDALLVLAMIWETWIQAIMFMVFDEKLERPTGSQALRVVRVFRLTRLFRVARLLKNAPELLILAKGMVAGMRSVCATLCLMIIAIYMFAIVFTRLLSSEAEVAQSYFDTVPMAMHFLFFQAISGGIDKGFLDDMMSAGLCYWALALMYFFVTQMTMMNMLIGVLCQVVSDMTNIEKEKKILEDLESMVRNIVEELDAEHTGHLTREEFDEILTHPILMQNLNNLGVDLVAFVDFTRFAFPKHGLSVPDFLQLVLQFRGEKSATVKDIVDMRKFICMMVKQLEGRFEQDLRKSISRHMSATGLSPEVSGPSSFPAARRQAAGTPGA